MYHHAPENYICPICLGVQGVENSDTLIRKTDIVYQDDLVTAFISSFFIGKNTGHVVVVPNSHRENLYDMPDELLGKLQVVVRDLAKAVRGSYPCEGITILQNNEPAGNQHAFHYHTHIFPRYTNDDLHSHMMEKTKTTAEDRLPFAEKLRAYLKNH